MINPAQIAADTDPTTFTDQELDEFVALLENGHTFTSAAVEFWFRRHPDYDDVVMSEEWMKEQESREPIDRVAALREIAQK